MSLTYLPKALEMTIAELNKLPGIGRRSAERMAFALLNGDADRTAALCEAITRLRSEVAHCSICGYYTEQERCPFCSDSARDHGVVCVVEKPVDVIAFERAGGFRGVFHVLDGVLSPLRGVTPEDLNIPSLLRRVRREPPREIILATSPSVEGDATALWLSQELRDIAPDLPVTRIGRGVPMGGSLDLTDGGTLRLALEGRRAYQG